MSVSEASPPKSKRGASSLALFLQDLTGLRAFVLFTISLALALAAAAVASAPNVNALVSYFVPSVPVLLYASVLVLAQRRLYVQLNGTLRDSPYFLGFIVTMGELVLVFVSIANRWPLEGNGVAQVVRAAGGAVVPTVVGLFSRQALLSLDTSEEAVDRVWESLAREVRQRTFDLKQAQDQFVTLITEFASKNEELLSREEAASRSYVQLLEATTRSFAHLPERAKGIDTHLLAVTESLKGIATSLSERRDIAGRELDKSVIQLRARYEEDAKLLAQALAASGKAVSDEASVFLSALKSVSDRATTHVDGLESTVRRLGPATEAVTQSLDTLAKQADATKGTLAATLVEMSRSGQLLSQTIGNVDRSREESQLRLASQLEALSKDLQAIDAVVDQVVKHVSERLAALGKLR